MPERTDQKSTKTVEFSNFGRRVVQGRFDGGSMTSDGGVMLLNETDRKLGLTQAAARCIPDPRSPLLITHAVRDMLRQRIYGLALGWEDLNDHGALRLDIAMQTAVGVEHKVASAPTLCRLESWSDRKAAPCAALRGPARMPPQVHSCPRSCKLRSRHPGAGQSHSRAACPRCDHSRRTTASRPSHRCDRSSRGPTE